MSLILVVDDQAIIREPIAAALRGAGHRTVSAANGREAMEAVRRERPDLVLLDVSMPEMDGVAFLAALRSLPLAAGVPVILLTAAVHPSRVVDAARMGVQDLICKCAFSGEDLLKRVARHCRAEDGEDAAAADAGADAD